LAVRHSVPSPDLWLSTEVGELIWAQGIWPHCMEGVALELGPGLQEDPGGGCLPSMTWVGKTLAPQLMGREMTTMSNQYISFCVPF
jgi:hypothetical protein